MGLGEGDDDGQRYEHGRPQQPRPVRLQGPCNQEAELSEVRAFPSQSGHTGAGSVAISSATSLDFSVPTLTSSFLSQT